VTADLPAEFFRHVQAEICAALEAADGGATFREDAWERPGGGGGFTRILTDGRVFERAGVGYSEVMGALDPAFAARLPGEGTRFRAAGVSLVLHPKSPMIPTVHANFRAIDKGDTRWFGGGMDLTPYVLDATYYPRLKRWCDAYFTLPHRGEMRGVGGIFFDYLGLSADEARLAAGAEAMHLVERAVPHGEAFAFVRSAASAFLPAYLPLVERRRDDPWGDSERNFQLLRRGRYVEFNLIYDRGTTFGLRTGGRTESILMSMPPLARWEYDYQPLPGSPEARLIDAVRNPREWA
jgi:coproporphyrinogen III oxidase